MEMAQNWDLYIKITKSKSEAHMRTAYFWNNINTYMSLSLILLGSVTTIISLLDTVPAYVVSIIAGITTLTSAINAFLKPNKKGQLYVDASKDYKMLMFKMVRCESDKAYEGLWNELNKEILEEPIIPKRFAGEKTVIDWSISPELQIIIHGKEEDLQDALGDDYEALIGSGLSSSSLNDHTKSNGKDNGNDIELADVAGSAEENANLKKKE